MRTPPAGLSEIDNIRRFASAQRLCGDAGLCPSTNSSGGKTFIQGPDATNGCVGPLLYYIGNCSLGSALAAE
ncbi:MAG TPA: transposase [Terrimicrobiaceae bacterium]